MRNYGKLILTGKEMVRIFGSSRRLINMLMFLCLLSVIMYSCKDNNKKEQPKVNKRNLSVTKSNAYNNLFLDSMAMEKFILAQKMDHELADAMRDFYNARNFEYAWFASDGLTEQAQAFRSLYKYADDSTKSNRSLEQKLDDFASADSMRITERNRPVANAEMQLTSRFIRSSKFIYKGDEIGLKESQSFVPAKKTTVLKHAEAILADDHTFNKSFQLLKEQLRKYYALAQKGGWQVLPVSGKTYKPATNNAMVKKIKQRLAFTGDFPANDTSDTFNPQLQDVVKKMQASYGFKPNGVIGKSLIEAMNVSAAKRLEQLVVNIERMNWVPPAVKGVTIFVNIPEFMLYVQQGDAELFNMPVVVGKQGNSTTMFYGDLNQVVFSPYWNIPKSITEKEILPGIEKDKDYLAKKNMEIKEEVNGVPVIRQLPGEDNPLGRVKFLFPNSFDIYFHDTNEKDLFSKEKRAYSHGCIRLSDPVKLANFLLKDMKEWTPEKIDSAMNSGQEKYVRIHEPVPVVITYYTAWVDRNGLLNLRDDTYGHDAAMSKKLFTDAQL